MNYWGQENEVLRKEKMGQVVQIIEKMISLSNPITYSEFNKVLSPIDLKELVEFEKEHPEVGLASTAEGKILGISTLSIIATVTSILVGDRLAFKISDGSQGEPPSGTIMGVAWYSESFKEEEENEKNEQ